MITQMYYMGFLNVTVLSQVFQELNPLKRHTRFLRRKIPTISLLTALTLLGIITFDRQISSRNQIKFDRKL